MYNPLRIYNMTDLYIKAKSLSAGYGRGRGRGMGRGRGRGNSDLFRSRKQNTSRPPSMHVDDFMAMEQQKGQDNMQNRRGGGHMEVNKVFVPSSLPSSLTSSLSSCVTSPSPSSFFPFFHIPTFLLPSISSFRSSLLSSFLSVILPPSFFHSFPLSVPSFLLSFLSYSLLPSSIPSLVLFFLPLFPLHTSFLIP